MSPVVARFPPHPLRSPPFLIGLCLLSARGADCPEKADARAVHGRHARAIGQFRGRSSAALASPICTVARIHVLVVQLRHIRYMLLR